MSEAALLESIIGAASSAAALGLPAPLRCALPSAAEVRTAFRRRALRVHPDKCGHSLATEAFRRLTDAYEELTARCATASTQPARSAAPHTPAPTKKRRQRSWAEWEAELRKREAAERAFSQMLSSRFAQRHAARSLRKARSVCEELDERDGIVNNVLLPAASRAAAAAAAAAAATAADCASRAKRPRRRFTEEPQEEPGERCPPAADSLPPAGRAAAAAAVVEEEPAAPEDDPQLLVALLVYLRDTHQYCLFCATRFGSPEELERDCPGVLECNHEEEAGGGTADDFDGVGDYF
jgi:hypothetical protein